MTPFRFVLFPVCSLTIPHFVSTSRSAFPWSASFSLFYLAFVNICSLYYLSLSPHPPHPSRMSCVYDTNKKIRSNQLKVIKISNRELPYGFLFITHNVFVYTYVYCVCVVGMCIELTSTWYIPHNKFQIIRKIVLCAFERVNNSNLSTLSSICTCTPHCRATVVISTGFWFCFQNHWKLVVSASNSMECVGRFSSWGQAKNFRLDYPCVLRLNFPSPEILLLLFFSFFFFSSLPAK